MSRGGNLEGGGKNGYFGNSANLGKIQMHDVSRLQGGELKFGYC
jgi:hypothetical protein